MHRAVTGSAWGIASTAACALVLLPFRASLAIATVGLVLVVPVVIGVVTGGVGSGVVSVAAGFLVYDLIFIPPYYTLSVGASENWVALGVYVAVMLIVARVVSRLQEARAEAQRRSAAAERMLELSELLVTDAEEPVLVRTVADAVRAVFGAAGVALLVPGVDGLTVVATSGEPPSEAELADLRSPSGIPVALTGGSWRPERVTAVPLVSSGRPIGVLALSQPSSADVDRDLRQTFVNQVALAIEQRDLRERALRSQLLEQGDRMRRALLSSVSHDLRTPLATMKVAATSLLDSDAGLDAAARRQLYQLLDSQSDRLDRLVTGLLDMYRYQAGALQLRLDTFPLRPLVEEAVAAVQSLSEGREVQIRVPEQAPPARADRVLVGQVLVNLLDNALRHGPPAATVTVSAEERDGHLVVSVEDRGPGVPAGDREAVFQSFYRSGSGGRAGLGLWICRTFVEAHGERLWVEDGSPGARFSFTLPAGAAGGA